MMVRFNPTTGGARMAMQSALCGLALATTLASAPAQAQNLPLIRDTEIEQLMREYAQPILRAAGLAKQNVRVVILSDRSFNAFVMDGRHIFINAGALTDRVLIAQTAIHIAFLFSALAIAWTDKILTASHAASDH